MACYFIFSSLTANADTQINLQQAQLVRLPTPGEFSTPALKKAEPVIPQVTQSGQMIINTRCSPRHMNSSFNQIVNTPGEWEETLTLMKAMGMQIRENKKVVLLEDLLRGNRA